MKAKYFKKILEICLYYSPKCKIDFKNSEIIGNNFNDINRNFSGHLDILHKHGAIIRSSSVISFNN